MLSRRKPGKHQRSQGFVLIEVLVTAAVAAVLLAALARAFSSVWGGIGAVREETEAMLVARAVIETSTPRNNLGPMTQEGTSGRYAWTIAIASTGVQAGAPNQQTRPQPDRRNAANQPAANQRRNPDPNPDRDPDPNAKEQEAGEIPETPWTLFRIAVAVRAPSGRRTTLETLRLSRPTAR